MAMLDVILLQRIESLGQMGDVVKVKPGFARNFLLPQKKAMRATKDNIAHFERQRAQLEAQNLRHREEAQTIAQRMEGLSVVIIRQAGETGQLYGSVSNRDVSDAVTKSGFTIERRQVLLDQPIKALGLSKTRVALHPEVVVMVTVNVAQSEEEAAIQAAGGKPKAEAEGAAAPEAAPAAEAPAEAATPKPKKAKKAQVEPASEEAEAKPKKTKKKEKPAA
jgi:large subunit ribosomal protein L9